MAGETDGIGVMVITAITTTMATAMATGAGIECGGRSTSHQAVIDRLQGCRQIDFT
jgi:hypothetical protein